MRLREEEEGFLAPLGGVFENEEENEARELIFGFCLIFEARLHFSSILFYSTHHIKIFLMSHQNLRL